MTVFTAIPYSTASFSRCSLGDRQLLRRFGSVHRRIPLVALSFAVSEKKAYFLSERDAVRRSPSLSLYSADIPFGVTAACKQVQKIHRGNLSSSEQSASEQKSNPAIGGAVSIGFRYMENGHGIQRYLGRYLPKPGDMCT